MANALVSPAAVLGLMGRQSPLRSFGLMGGTDATEEERRRRELEQAALAQQQQMAAQQPAQRERVSGWNVLGRVLAPETFGAIDDERERLQGIADRPQLLQRQAENERIAGALGPEALLAYRTAPGELGKSLAGWQNDVTLAEGSVRNRGGRNIAAAPVVDRFDDRFGVYDPINPQGGAQYTAPRGMTASEETSRFSAQNPVLAANSTWVGPDGQPRASGYIAPNVTNVAPGGEALITDAQGNLTQRYGSTSVRPMSDADQAAVAKAEGTIATLDTALNRAQAIESQIANGELNLGPLTNMLSAGRNAIGQSDQNSLNYDSLLSWAKEARNAILQANTGVQTDQDAIRELDTILSGTRDERIVSAALGRFRQARTATRDVLQRDITRRSAANGPAPAQTSAARPRARNPQTGQVVELVDGAWVPVQ